MVLLFLFVYSHWVLFLLRQDSTLEKILMLACVAFSLFILIFCSYVVSMSPSHSFSPQDVTFGLTQVVGQRWHQPLLQPRPPSAQTPRTSCSAQGTRAERGNLLLREFESLQGSVISTTLDVFKTLCHVNLINSMWEQDMKGIKCNG